MGSPEMIQDQVRLGLTLRSTVCSVVQLQKYSAISGSLKVFFSLILFLFFPVVICATWSKSTDECVL